MDLFSDDADELGSNTTIESSDNLDSFLDFTGAEEVLDSNSLKKPWMKYHRFVLVKTVEEVAKIVDDAIAHGRCALDLETEGFDNRIDYDEENRPKTRHQIVGYCLSIKGVGYYVPVRHLFNPKMGEKDPNVPREGVEAEILRLLLASRPDVEGEPFVHNTVPRPKVVIYFWNSKFDQEFLYAVTGIDIWHPSSFEDGMLAAYVIYSDDDLGLKINSSRRLSIKEGDEDFSYEMIKFEELFPKGTPASKRHFKTLYPEDGSDVVLYACSDAICTELLCEDGPNVKWEFTEPNVKFTFKNVTKLAKEKHDFTYRLEKRTVQGVRDMERRRVLSDLEEIKALLVRAEQELERYNMLIVDLASKHGFENFNPGSPQQLSEFLFEKKGLNLNPKPERTATGQYQTDATTLEALAENPEAPKVLEWIVKHRQVEKIIGTYLQNMVGNCDELGQLRFKFVQTGAATGRFSATSGEKDHGYSGVPVQGIPARDDPSKPEVAQSLRRAFIARTGYTLVKIDYAGQELRIVSNLSKEPKWVNEFLTAKAEGREADLHTLTAKAFFGDHITKENKKERNMGKTANFALIYGGGTGAIMRATKCDKMEAARRKANFDKSVPVFASWVKGQHAFVKKHKGVYTAFKRFIAIPDAGLNVGDTDSYGKSVQEQDVNRIKAACERKSTNFPIQGSGADIMKLSLSFLLKEFLLRGWRREGGDDSVRVLMTVHDELVFEIKHERLMEALPIIIHHMESPSTLANWQIPLVVEPLIGQSWEAKYDWLRIMAGKDPVPSWLEGIVTPGVAYVEKPKESQPPAKQQSIAPSRASTPPPLKPVTGTVRIATFVLGREDVLTEKSVRVVWNAVSGAVDPDSGIYLRIVTRDNDVLVDIGDRIFILPEMLQNNLNDRLAGNIYHEVREEAV